MDKEQIIEKVLAETRAFLIRTDFDKKIIFTSQVSAGAKIKVELEKVSPRAPKPLVSKGLARITDEYVWDLLLKTHAFASIKNPKHEKVARAIVAHLHASPDNTIMAKEILEIFKKCSLSLKRGTTIESELNFLRHAFKTKYGCALMRANDGEFTKDPERTFALFQHPKFPPPKKG